MTGGFMVSAGRLSLLAAAGYLLLGGASAQAADLGGNCCADLEERIAELEATTARKGNRKVSLTMYGQVNEAVMYWDDGFESNAYQVTNDNSRTRIGFKGDAKITGDWKAGYVIEIGIRSASSKRFTQDEDDVDAGLDLRHSYWHIGSKTYGKVSVGQTGGASESITEINQTQTSSIAKFSDQEDTGLGLGLRQANGNILLDAGTGNPFFTWRRLIRDYGDQPGEGRRYNLVKYDTPEIAGFHGTASWGEDDTWEIGLRYKGEFANLKVAAGIAYGENSEQKSSAGAVGFECSAQTSQVVGRTGKDAECNQFGGSISIVHEPTGLFLNAAGGTATDELILRSNRFVGVTGADDESTFWSLEAGIEKKFFDLGKTTIFGQYYDNEGGSNARRQVLVDGVGTSRILGTELTSYTLGVVQGLDAAAMQLYLYYRHYEADVTTKAGSSGNGGAVPDLNLEDLDVVTAGGIIKF